MSPKTKSGKKSSKRQGGPKSSSIQLRDSELRIKYSNSHDLLDKLQTAAQSVSRLHAYQSLAEASGGKAKAAVLPRLSQADLTEDLGSQAAIDIVTGCAGDTDLTATLGNIPGLDPVLFQSCVQSKVVAAGYKPASFSTSSSTALWQVAQAIQGSSK